MFTWLLLMLVLLVAFLGLKHAFLFRCVLLYLVCAGGAVLICFAASRWWVWCFLCLSDCNQSTEGKLSLFVTCDVLEVTPHFKSIMHLIDCGQRSVFSLLSMRVIAIPCGNGHSVSSRTIRIFMSLFILWLWATLLLLFLSSFSRLCSSVA